MKFYEHLNNAAELISLSIQMCALGIFYILKRAQLSFFALLC